MFSVPAFNVPGFLFRHSGFSVPAFHVPAFHVPGFSATQVFRTKRSFENCFACTPASSNVGKLLGYLCFVANLHTMLNLALSAITNLYYAISCKSQIV